MLGSKTELTLPISTIAQSVLNGIYEYERLRIPNKLETTTNHQSDLIARYVLEMIDEARASDFASLQLAALKFIEPILKAEAEFARLLTAAVPMPAHDRLVHASSYLYAQTQALFKRADTESIRYDRLVKAMPKTDEAVLEALSQRTQDLKEAQAARKRKIEESKAKAPIVKKVEPKQSSIMGKNATVFAALSFVVLGGAAIVVMKHRGYKASVSL